MRDGAAAHGAVRGQRCRQALSMRWQHLLQWAAASRCGGRAGWQKRTFWVRRGEELLLVSKKACSCGKHVWVDECGGLQGITLSCSAP